MFAVTMYPRLATRRQDGRSLRFPGGVGRARCSRESQGTDRAKSQPTRLFGLAAALRVASDAAGNLHRSGSEHPTVVHRPTYHLPTVLADAARTTPWMACCPKCFMPAGPPNSSVMFACGSEY